MKHLAHWDDVDADRREEGHLAGSWRDLGAAAGTWMVGLQRIQIDPGKWALLRSMADVVTSVEQLQGTVDRALQAPARLATARLQARELFANAGTASERGLAEVYELLDLRPLRPRAAMPAMPGVAVG